MPTYRTFTRTIEQLAPNTFDPNNSNSQSSWFSYVRTVYSRQRGGTVVPPTKTEFMREWNAYLRYNNDFTFMSRGETFEEHKEFLEGTSFPEFYISLSLTQSERWEKLKIITWTRMIMAFNMYADVRKLFHERKSNRVDFIGSVANRGAASGWEACFHGRCALYIRDEELINLIELVRDNRIGDFWRFIFHIYDRQLRDRRFRINTSHDTQPRMSSEQPCETYIESERSTPVVHNQIPVSVVPVVDAPVHAIAQEYLNRIDNDDDENVFSNQQIANMILNTRDPLPDEIKKIIHETCIALHISCPVALE